MQSLQLMHYRKNSKLPNHKIELYMQRAHYSQCQVTDSLDLKFPSILIKLLLYILSKAAHDQEAVGETSMAVLALRYELRNG